jgi:hypothetical protein
MLPFDDFLKVAPLDWLIDVVTDPRVRANHGNTGSAVGCPCEVCAAAHREASARWRAQRRVRLGR